MEESEALTEKKKRQRVTHRRQKALGKASREKIVRVAKMVVEQGVELVVGEADGEEGIVVVVDEEVGLRAGSGQLDGPNKSKSKSLDAGARRFLFSMIRQRRN